MEHHLELKSISRNQQISGKAEKILSPQVSQSKKVGDRLKSEKFNLSYADLHHEITKSVDNILPKSLGNHLKQRVEGKATEDEELVKYMSNLPSYLERRENFQEKALSFGVLDWGRLEKWQYDHKQIPNKSGRHSSSSSNSSSLFSTDESSTHSSGGHSCSPRRQRIHRPTLQSHLKASPAEGFSEGVKFFGGNAGKFQDLNAPSGTPFSGQQRFIKTNQSSCQIQSEIKLEKCKINSSNPKASAEMRTSTNLENCEMASCSKGKMKIQDGDFAERKEGSKEPNPIIIFKECPKKYRTAVAHSPRDLPKNGHSGLSQLPGSSAARGSTEAPRRSFSERSNSTKVHSAKLYSGIPHSCPLPCDVDSSKASQIKQPSSMDVGSIKVPFDASVCPTNLVRSKNPEEKKPTIVPTNSTAREPSEGSDLKKGTVAAAKVRNSSPTRRFSISMSRIIRSSSSKDGMAIPPLSSSHVDTKSGPDRAMAACMDSYSDGQNATSRARSSPLRRLLDPLLKPKAGNSHQFPEPLQKDSTSIDRSYLSSKEQLDSSNSRSGKVKLDLSSCRTINVNDSYRNKKHGSLPVQALLQVAVKNGLPLFTFAVDGDKDILAATMRKSTIGKDDYSWIYTFFTISEVKKKNRSWINQGQKGKGHGYIPNVVAQMKVSDSQFSSLTICNSTKQFSLREFVLFAVDLRQADEQTSNIQPNDELAAMVVKIPKENTGSSIKDEQQSSYFNDLSASVSNGNSPEVKCQPVWEENVQNQPFAGSQDHFITKVILPSGVHSLPNKGEPSRLLERWKSGGSCDCGGWDMGCKLRVLVNQNQHRKKPSPPTTDRFELFSLVPSFSMDQAICLSINISFVSANSLLPSIFLQEGVEADEPIFSMSSFKDGIYSAEFSSPLSLLQAFSICIAVLNSRTQPSEMSNPSEERSDGIIKAPNQVQGEAAARYVSYPPLSPVGRV